MEKPAVSVIMPTYNQEQFIGEAINSVLNQSYENYELIIVNNFSDDNTEKIILSYAAKDKRVKYEKFSNKGIIAASRNYGIRLAQGDFICFLDSDDTWFPEKLEKQVAYMGKNKDVFLLYSKCLIEKDGKLQGESPEKMKSGSIFRELFLAYNMIPCLTVMMRNRKDRDPYLFDEDKSLVTIEDYDLWLRISRSKKISFISQPLAIYRVHSNNMSSDLFLFFDKVYVIIKKFASLVPKSILVRKYMSFYFMLLLTFIKVAIRSFLNIMFFNKKKQKR